MVNSSIIIFYPGLNVGGIEKVFCNYAALLSNAGYKITFLTCRENADLINLVPDKVEFVNLRTNRLSKSLFALINFIRKRKPDYILTANIATIFVFLAKILSNSHVKILASHHSYFNNEAHSIWDKHILFKVYNLCWKVIAVSNGIKQHLIEQSIYPEKIFVINNPINTDEITTMLNEKQIITDKYIAFVGRLSTVKNLDFLLMAYKKFMVRTHGNIKLLIVGDGPERLHIEQEIKKMNLQQHIILLGALENPYSIMSKAALVVLPSYSEAFPTVLLESLFLGKTVVATPTSGALEILQNGQLGYISTSFNNEDEFSSLLINGINNPFDPSFLQDKFNLLYDPKKSIDKFIKLII